MTPGLSRLCCPHGDTTAPDGQGRAICVRCGSVVQTQLTRDVLELALDRALYGFTVTDAWGNRVDPAALKEAE